MTSKKKILYGIGAVVLGYYLYRYFKKPKSVLVQGSDKSTPDQVQYSTGKEKLLSASGELNVKTPIYIKPQNSIPNVYDRGIGQDVNFSGGFRYANGSPENLQTQCSMNKVKTSQATLTELPKIPQN